MSFHSGQPARQTDRHKTDKQIGRWTAWQTNREMQDAFIGDEADCSKLPFLGASVCCICNCWGVRSSKAQSGTTTRPVIYCHTTTRRHAQQFYDKQSKLSLLFLDAWNAVHATVRSEGMEAAGDVFFFRSVYPLAWVLRHSYHLGCLELKLLAMNVCPSTSVAYRFGTVVSWNILQSKVRTIVLWSVVWMLEW